MHPCVDLCKLNVAEDLPHTVVTAPVGYTVSQLINQLAPRNVSISLMHMTCVAIQKIFVKVMNCQLHLALGWMWLDNYLLIGHRCLY